MSLPMKSTTMTVLLLFLLLSGCATGNIVATITSTGDKVVHTYEGPKDVEMSVKKGKDSEVRYSGKSPSLLDDVLRFLLIRGSK